MHDWLIVGAGFAGSVLAERIASQRNETVLIIDKRSHIAGNAYDHLNENGILVHKYGPHIFHTNSSQIVSYLSKFTNWRPYEHRVLAKVDGQLVPIPINRTTINRLYKLDLSESEVENFLRQRAVPGERPKNSEEAVVQKVGWDLYRKFFQGYTRKQWGLDPSELEASVTARIPVRYGDDDRYFGDTFQQMPSLGYTRLFENMLSSPNIDVELETAYADVKGRHLAKRVIYSGPIDEYFGYRFGKLPYRSLRFEHVTLPIHSFQPAAVVNYPQTEAYTRITEYKKLTGQSHPQTSISYEFSSSEGDPFYPVPRPQNAELFAKYDALARAQDNVWFVGRLANYRYYNMDQVVGQALKTFSEIDAQLNGTKKAPALFVGQGLPT